MLCDDILLRPDGSAERACEIGRSAFAAAGQAIAARRTGLPENTAAAWRGDRTLPLGTALDAAAQLLRGCRRVLVTGLAGATLEAVAGACDVAECLAAAVDTGAADMSRAAGPTIARAGEVTAAWEELRDRADLVVFWFCDPAATHPRFIERFVRHAVHGPAERRTIAVGPEPVLPPGPLHRHLPLPAGRSVEAARMLHWLVSGQPAGSAAGGPPSRAVVAAVAAAIEQVLQGAGCVAIVTADAADAVGLEPWSVVRLVRLLAHGRPAFGIPLGAGVHAGGGNAAGAAMVCTWRYGAPGGIARADRLGSECLPGECDARRLVERGEVDGLLAVGPLAPGIEEAIRARRPGLSIVRLTADTACRSEATATSIQIRCAGTLPHAAGTMLREDGTRVALPGNGPAADAPPMEMILAELAGLIRRAASASATGAAT